MTIRIEVTGHSVPEIADKLLALAGQMGAVPARDCGYDHTPNAETVAAMEELLDKPKTTRKSKKVEQEDVGNQSANSDTEASSAPATTQDDGDQTSESGQTAQAAASPSEEAPALDFDKEVAPVVIETVQRLGKPAVSELLAEFGVERASEVDPSLYGELVERLQAL